MDGVPLMIGLSGLSINLEHEVWNSKIFPQAVIGDSGHMEAMVFQSIDLSSFLTQQTAPSLSTQKQQLVVLN